MQEPVHATTSRARKLRVPVLPDEEAQIKLLAAAAGLPVAAPGQTGPPAAGHPLPPAPRGTGAHQWRAGPVGRPAEALADGRHAHRCIRRDDDSRCPVENC